MKKTDIFDIAIKLFGLYFIAKTIFSVKDFILMLGATASTDSDTYDHRTTTSFLLTYGLYIFLQLLFSPLQVLFHLQRIGQTTFVHL